MTATATQAKETVQSEALYAKVAPRYDTVFERAILAEGRLTEVVQENMTGRSVLDLACGNGRWLDRFRPAAYVGLDLSRAMLQEARRRYPDARFIQADMTCLPFPDESFEGVISMFGAMGHLAPAGQEAMMREVWRVLQPGGLAVLTNGNLWSPFNLPTTMTGGRVRIEGVRLHVHSTTPRKFARSLTGFRLLRLESYDYSYLPLLPLKFAACLVGRDYRAIYAHWMDLFDHCRYIPTMRWFGKQLLVVCEKMLYSSGNPAASYQEVCHA
jgi:ubiquinone/menaquinone biosynthesis C-methylase UbiE